jgi:hypothetical protein
VTPLELLKQMELGVAEICEASAKGMDPIGTHELVEALEQFRRSVTFAIEVWRANEVVVLGAAGGSTMVAPNAVATVRTKRRERYDHDLIGRKVILHAIREITSEGEVLFDVDDPEVAADRAVALMRALYVADAVEPKVGGLMRLGFETKWAAMSSSEVVGSEVKVRPK